MADEARHDAGEEVTAEPYKGGTEIVHHQGGHVAAREVRMEVIRPLNPAQVVESMREHQTLLEAILDASDWQGNPGATGSFVKKSGWRKVALAYNLTLERVGEEVERRHDGMPVRATFTARAIAPNGRGVEATGHCSFDESRFSGPRGNVTKLENDLRATAETRAKNRAISDLIGMGKVSAEEAASGGGGADANAPKWGMVADEANLKRARNALLYQLGGKQHEAVVDAMLAGWVETFGYVPAPMTYAVIDVGMKVREVNTPAGDPPPGDPPAEPEQDEPLTPEEEAELARQAEGAGVTLDGTEVHPPEPAEPIVDATVVDPPRSQEEKLLDVPTTGAVSTPTGIDF